MVSADERQSAHVASRLTKGGRFGFAMMRGCQGPDRCLSVGRTTSQEEHRIGGAAAAWLPNGP